MAKKKAAAWREIRVDPNSPSELLVGETYTASIALEDGETEASFIAPSGRAVGAAIYQGRARASFLVERSGEMSFGFKVGGNRFTVEYGTRVR